MSQGRRVFAAFTALAIGAGLAVAGGSSHAVRAANPTPGIVTTVAGGSTTGYATSIQQAPWGVAWLGSNLLISDSGGARLYSLNLATGVESVFAGNGQAGPSGDGGPASAAAIGYPLGLAVDGSGDVFFAAHDRVREVLANGTITSLAAGMFTQAEGVAVDTSGNVYIADTGSNVIGKLSGGTLTVIAGGGLGCSEPCLATQQKLWGPQGVAVDASGNVFIADTDNFRVREVDHSTGMITTVAGTGAAGSCAAGPALTTPLWFPAGVSFDSGGNLLITESQNNCVRKLSGGSLTVVAIGAGLPQNAVADASGNLFVASPSGAGPNGGLVFKFTAPSTSTVVAGSNGSCLVYGIGGPATSARLCGPDGITVGADGELYIADPNANQVVKIDTGGVLRLVAGTGTAGTAGDNGPATSAQLNTPASVALDASGNVYITDTQNYAIRRVDHVSGTITTVAGTLGVYGFAGDGGPATSAKLFGPGQTTFDAAGNLYIADGGNYRVRKVGLDGNISTIAGDGSSASDTFHGQPATTAHLNAPSGVAIDSLGNVFISSIGSTTRVDSQGNIYLWSNWSPSFVAMGPANRLIGNAGCQAILLPSASVPVVLAGASNAPGCSGNTGDGGPALSAQFDTLYGIGVDASGDIFVADRFNKRVHRVQAYVAPVAPAAPTAVAGRNSANVQWSAPADTGGLPITINGYTVATYAGATGYATAQVAFTTPTTAQVTRLATGTAYTFTVIASNGWAASPESAHSAAVTPILTPAGTITTFAGAAGSGAGTGIGQLPYAIAAGFGPADGFNHVFIGDLANPVVRDFNLNMNQESVLAGSDGYGFAGDGGPPLAALMQGAGAVADCGGTIYIADTLNYVIREVNYTGKIFTVAGNGTPGYSGDGFPGTQAQIGRVLGLACRSGGGIYISDSDNGAVRILNGGIITTWWRGFSFPTGLVELPQQQGIMFPVNDVAVADAGGDNAVFELTDTNVYLLAGTPGHSGNTGDGVLSYQALLNNPRGVGWYGSAGGFWFYIADTGNNRIRIFDSRNFIINNASGDPNGIPGTDPSHLNGPTGLAVFNSTLYVADTGNALVRSVFVGGGPITTFAGNGTLSFSGDGGPAASAEMGIPYAIALDSSGNQYIADSQNNLVRKVDVTGTIMSLGANAGLKNPRGVAVDASGAVYVSDTNNQRVIRIAPGGGVTIMAMGLNRPRGLALDAQGHLFIADTGNNRVVEVTSPGVVTVVAGNGQLNGPRALAFDSQGNLFISDSDSNRIRELSNGVLTTIAGTGVAGAAGDGGPATSAQLNFPFGLGFDGAGNLYIADTGNNRLRVIQHGIITTVVGVCGGVSGFSGDGGLASTAQLNVPYGIAVDSAGDVYVADAFNNRIRGASAITGLRGGTCQSPPTGKGGGSRLIDLGPGPRLASSTQPSSTVKPAAPTRLIHPSAGSPVTAPSRVVPPAAQSHAANVPPAEVAAPSHSARAPVMSRMATPAPQNPMYASALGAVPLLCVALFALVRWRRRRL